ncbi:MAG: LeuA family protein [Anaerolineales bacterium]
MNSTDNSDRYRHYHPRPMEIIDTTLREGQQTSLLHDHHKYFYTERDKVELIRAMILFGVKFIEMFSPVVSPQEREDVNAIQQIRDELVTQKGYTFLLAHVRCHPDDVGAAIRAGFDGLNIYIGTSPQSRAFNTGKDLEQIARNARTLLEDLRRNHPHLILRFSGEDTFRTRLEDQFQVYDQVASLVDRLGLPDTVGVATPGAVGQRIRALRERYPVTEFEVHFHDDRGFALSNTLEAIREGVRYVNTTLLGIGERSGITSMTALLFNLYLEQKYDLLEGYHLRGSYPVNVLAADKLRMLVPPKEPISLTNRTHTAGVHQGAMLNDSSTYEAHPLDVFGVSERDILLGPLSGWNTIHYFLKEINYFRLDEATARDITARFKERVYQIDADQSPAELLLAIATEEYKLPKLLLPESARKRIVQRLDEEPPPKEQVQ